MMMLPSTYPSIKRIINGVSYNTETSTLLKSRSTAGDPVRSTPYGPAPMPNVEQLFRNRSGKFFFVGRSVPVFDSAAGAYVPRDEIHPATRETAAAWMKHYFPNDQETFFLNMPFAARKAQPEAEATLSLRLDPYWKGRLKSTADSRGTSINALTVSYLRYGLSHSVGYPDLPPDLFTTEDGVKLLTADGKPGLNGVEDDGTDQELTRAHVAKNLWAEGKMIPENIRNMLIAILSMDEPEREQLLNDVQRWLQLYDRPRANLSEGLMKNFVPTMFVNPT
jgi:hypothetical protein